MGVFLYEARNRAGELFAGTIEAKDKREAAGLIRRRGLWIASLSPQEAALPGRCSLPGSMRCRRLNCACCSCGRWPR